ncbi:hypothetical protein [Streptomyces sp. JNUCC 63]
MPGDTPGTADSFVRRRELPEMVGATLSGPAFVTGRFATLQSRRPVAIQEGTHA